MRELRQICGARRNLSTLIELHRPVTHLIGKGLVLFARQRYAPSLAPLLCAIWELRQAEWTEFSLADGRSAYG
ncbi:hypothetical protein LMTR13_26345 [Bradyrhizobium icense]|uniref:Uncharacterized protein n=1 Tax=Bradyrhizobium icense TaxID=1274631 RepID=A0A1B1UK91_9BRAD|nr:hypothetical protein LMTR13_26345 [Bradyrhizobium icense]